ncbi:TIGR02281 family clan AA aspartic protease [Sphingomonas sp. BIUV-7]|uniref:TIGR02281 family clan AA aspartic protease n=1 Tax=Sphingomonas natans TaxID=3063330 RepID=A0ABT8YD88_9SPHN|nr:TIGR02281 family clan AA aspartic protease [Sphingomonas sp. BIUV-7]MDO6416345.1 TIGR02281 family clan AA aspartic protease [Sphingomonas sp. BIUV-7]
MAGHLGIAVMALGTLLTAGLPTAYTLGATRPAQAEAMTPDLAPSAPVGDQYLARSADGFFYASAEVNGRKVRLLIDTGASAIMLSTAEATRLGVPVKALAYHERVMTSAGSVPMARVMIDHMTVAGRTFQDVPAMVTPSSSGIGLMGQSLLARFQVVSISGDTLKLS